VKLQNSSSDFSVYSTNGEQLAGDLARYQELAHEIDKKRIVLYIDVSGQVVLCGTRLMVRIIGGREERAIFIRRYPLPEFSLKKDRVRSFYTEAKSRVESMARIRYEILGLLKEGDLLVPERSIGISTIAALAGKTLVHEPVRIRIENLPLSFGVVSGILESFTQHCIPRYTIAIAQYPLETDILISPNVSGTDLDISAGGGERIQPGFEKNRPFFEAVLAIYDLQRASLHANALQDPDTLSRLLKKSLLDSDIVNGILGRGPADAAVILDIYRNDADALHTLVKKILTSTKHLEGVSPDIVALVVGRIIESGKPPSSEDREILMTGYRRGDDDLKKEIRHYLVLREVFEDYFLADLVKSSVNGGNIQLLASVITSRKLDDKGLQVIKNALKTTGATQDQVLKFIELIFASNLDTVSKGGGHQIYLGMIEHYQQQHFSTRRLNQLQDRYGRTRNPPSRQVETRTIVLSLLCGIALIGLVLSVAIHLGLFPVIPAANQTTVNPKLPETTAIQNISGPTVLLITVLNGSYFEVNGNQTGWQGLNSAIAASNATLVSFSGTTTNETVPRSSINESVLRTIIGRTVNAT
jgi:hypothetical protein